MGYRKPRRSFLQARTGIPPGYSVSWREVQAPGTEQISLELQAAETTIVSSETFEMAEFDGIQRLWSGTIKSFKHCVETQDS